MPGRYLAQAKASIRLLELLPGQLEDSLQCTLRAYDLAHAPTYEALSYCWGPASSLLPITIDGDSLMVTPNLRSALRHLRRTDYARTLWIDAICINQDDVEERGAQVAIMADIYRNAAQTVIWLGPSESHSRQALRTLALLSEKPKQPNVDRASWSSEELPCEGDGAHVIPADSRVVSDLQGYVSAVASRPWFKRIWVVQELALARRAEVLCGTDALGWETFIQGLKIGLTIGFFETRTFGFVSDDDFSDILSLARAREPARQIGCPAERLLRLLYSHHTRGTTDPRDKVYSLLGLVGSDASDLGIEPDYRKDCAAIYHGVAVTILRGTFSLDMLGMRTHACSSTDLERLPSWVPDWSTTESKMVPLTMINGEPSPPAHATMSSSTVLRFSADYTHLLLSGHIVDSIVDTSEMLTLLESGVNCFNDEDDPTDDWDLDMLPDSLTTWRSRVDFLRKELPGFLSWMGTTFAWLWKEVIRTAETLECFVRWEEFAGVQEIKQRRDSRPADVRMIAYWKTLCAGNRLTNEDEIPDDMLTEAAFWEWRKTLGPTRKLLKIRTNGLSSSTYKSAAFIGYMQKTWKSYSKFNALLDHAYNRKLAKTKRGHLALVPGDARAGDVIALCKGGRVPLCLRRADAAAYTLLGEAYVHEIMDGRAFDEELCEAIALR